jgi:hypothetical protein
MTEIQFSLFKIGEKHNKELLSKGLRYIRYVDDIRIFSNSQLSAQKAAMELEVLCRNIGLIPQGKKFAIYEAKSEPQILDMLPSQFPPEDLEEIQEEEVVTEREALSKFRKSISGRPYKITDKTLARYLLFRAPASRKLLDIIIRLLPRHPEHIEAFSAYMSNFSKSVPLENSLKDLLKNGAPYQYVRSEFWLTLARISSEETCQELQQIAINDLSNTSSTINLKWGALAFLLKCQKYGLGNSSYRIKHQHPLVQALLTPIIPEIEYERNVVIKPLLLSKDFIPGLLLAGELIKRGKTHLSYGLKIREIPPQTQNQFRTLGIIRRRFNINVDQISNILVARYSISPTRKWRLFLTNEYNHALQILIQADALFFAGRSEWLALQNSFNDAITRSFIGFLNSNNLPGARSLINSRGDNITFCTLLYVNSPFTKYHPIIGTTFDKLNRRRNKLPVAHPYDERSGAQTKYLSAQERNMFKVELGSAYNNLIRYVDQNT